MKSGLAGLMQQAQKMQENIKKAQEELEQMEIKGESGAGMVKIIMTGRHDVRQVEIDPSLIGAEADKEMLEDLIAAAVNDAVRKVEKESKEKMAGMVGGFGLPAGMKLPF